MKKNGFTLIELIFIIAIITVLLGIGSFSVKKMIERNDYSKITSIIPQMISTEAIKAFEEGDEKTIDLYMDSHYISTENEIKELPKNYSYSLYLLEWDESNPTKIIGSSGKASLTADTEGKIIEIQINSDESNKNLSNLKYPSILVSKKGKSFCRIDIVSSQYITPRVITYHPKVKSLSNIGIQSDWEKDN